MNRVAATIGSTVDHDAFDLVGRERELERLVSAIDDDRSVVTFVHGAPGVGKSALLRALAEPTGANVEFVTIECRDVEPTPRAVLDELGRQFGARIEGLAELSEAMALREPIVIALDTYERFRLVDRWVREELVPALPVGARLVLMGRDEPVPAWALSAHSPMFFTSLKLGRLSDADAVAFLRGIGVAEGPAIRLARLARGHPLTLRLAAATALARPQIDVEEQAAPAALEALVRLYVADLPAATRRVLDAASVVRRMTLPLLGAMLSGEPAEPAFERLSELPFTDVVRDGLVLHEALQEAIAQHLRATDPERYRRYRTLAWRQLRREVRAVPRDELWRYTADMLYLIENPIVREAFFPSSSQRVSVAPATRSDGFEMSAIARTHERRSEAELLEAWFELAPEACHVARAEEGVSGFAIVTAISDIPVTIRQTDPVVGAWRDHLQANPVKPGEIVLVLRRWLDRDCGEAPSPTQAAFWLEVKRIYMELRPSLRRIYVVLHDPAPHLPVLLELGFVPFEPIDVKGTSFHPAFLDFGPGSVDGWLAGLAARELGVDDTRLLNREARELLIDDQRVPLTRIEFALVDHLLARGGAVSGRSDILRAVWKTDHEGSNVIEAAVRSLRRKLGPEAHRLETVRGIGYRLRSE